jgi:tetratricopeptide (TPR) repeat protein
MSRRKAKSARIHRPKSSSATLVLLALIAGSIGAGVTWLLVSTHRSVQPPIAPAVVADDGPPSVAHLPPAQAAGLLGHWHYDRQRWAAAAQQYEAALRLGLDNPDVRTDLGNCFRFLDKPEKARDQYERSQRQNPQHENSLFNLAALHAQVLHDNPKAQELLNEYLRRFPESDGAARAHRLLAELDDRKLSPDTERLLRELATDGKAPSK